MPTQAEIQSQIATARQRVASAEAAYNTAVSTFNDWNSAMSAWYDEILRDCRFSVSPPSKGQLMNRGTCRRGVNNSSCERTESCESKVDGYNERVSRSNASYADMNTKYQLLQNARTALQELLTTYQQEVQTDPELILQQSQQQIEAQAAAEERKELTKRIVFFGIVIAVIVIAIVIARRVG